MKKILLLLFFMLLLSYIGLRTSSHIYHIQNEDFTTVLDLLKSNFLFILLLNLMIYGLEMLRLRLIGYAVDLKITWKDCFGAVALNILFAWITPGAILGAPALAYFLYLKKFPLAESITIAFVRSFSIIFVSALTTIFIYSFHLQELVVNPVLIEKVFYVLTALGIYISLIVILSFLPERIRGKVKFIKNITNQIQKFLLKGKLLLFPILFLGLIINFLLVAFIPYASAGYYENISPLIFQTLLFLSYLLLMPTPGASGLAEVGAPAFFSNVIPVEEMITTVTAMRISTIGLQILIGTFFMFYFFRRNISFYEIKKFKDLKMKTSVDDSHN